MVVQLGWVGLAGVLKPGYEIALPQPPHPPLPVCVVSQYTLSHCDMWSRLAAGRARQGHSGLVGESFGDWIAGGLNWVKGRGAPHLPWSKVLATIGYRWQRFLNTRENRSFLTPPQCLGS